MSIIKDLTNLVSIITNTISYFFAMVKVLFSFFPEPFDSIFSTLLIVCIAIITLKVVGNFL